MFNALHKNARTTLAARADIAASSEPASVLAKRYGITEQTVYKWKKREVVYDRPHTAHRLQTVLNPAQEAVVVYLRRTLMLPLDDLLAVTREFLCPQVSRSGLDRCLRRHASGALGTLKPKLPPLSRKDLGSHEPGCVYVDVKHLSLLEGETQRRYLFVAIDRSTRWGFVQIKAHKTAPSVQAFLKALRRTCPIRITKLITEHGKEFTERLFASKEEGMPGDQSEFSQLCHELGTQHPLKKSSALGTDAMLKRANGRIADVLKTHRFKSQEGLEQTLLRYVALYNHQLPQSALKGRTPVQSMKDWYQTHPSLFHRKPYERLRCDR